MDRNDNHKLEEEFFKALSEFNIEEDIIEYLEAHKNKLEYNYDPLDPNDQEIMRNKIMSLNNFLEGRKSKDITASEKKWLLNLFNQKY